MGIINIVKEPEYYLPAGLTDDGKFGLMSYEEYLKLSGIASGAEVNQNAFSTIKVGSTNVVADNKTDTLELVAGNNITLTPDANNDKITILSKNSFPEVGTGLGYTSTVSGNPVTVTDALPYNAVSLSAEIEAEQDLHGLPFPYVGGAYKNIIDFKAALDYWGADYTDNGDGSFTITRVGSGYSNPYQFATSPSVVSISAASIVSLTTGGNWRIEIFDETDGWKSINSATLSQAGVNANKIRLNYSNHGDGATISKVQIELGSSVTSYAPYANICPISGRTAESVVTEGENLTYNVLHNVNINSSATLENNNSYNICLARIIKGMDYIVTTDDPSGFVGGFYYDEPTIGSVAYDSIRHVVANKKFTAPITGYVAYRTTASYTTPKCEYGTVATPYVPYVGRNTATIQLGQTVYGGTLNVTTGVMTVNKAILDLGNLNWELVNGTRFVADNQMPNVKIDSSYNTPRNAISSQYVWVAGDTLYNTDTYGYSYYFESAKNRLFIKDLRYATAEAFKTAMDGVQLVYELATPQTIQLTPTQLTMLKGYNRLSSDGGGDITLTYLADSITGSETGKPLTLSLKSDTLSTLTASSKGNTTDREYAVGLDKNGNLSVNVPWPTITTATSSDLGLVKPDNSTITVDANGTISASADLTNYIQKSAIKGLVKNDGTIDESDFLRLKFELTGDVSAKTWNGLSSFSGEYVWTDGDNIYYSDNGNQYILDKSTSTWNTKTWTGLNSFRGNYIWIDGDNIYYSYNANQYVLNKSTSTWSTKTWNGISSFNGNYIWTDGENIYYSNSSNQYVLDKSTDTWNTKTWNGYTKFYGQYIWTDGTNIYCSYYGNQYILDKSTSTWSTKSWTGLSLLIGESIWTDGTNIYYSSDDNQYILDKSTSTWNTKTWTGLNSFSGEYVWTDGDNIYYSDSSNQYIFDKTDENTDGYVKPDGSIIPITASTTDLTDGVSPLATGAIYLVYET